MRTSLGTLCVFAHLALLASGEGDVTRSRAQGPLRYPLTLLKGVGEYILRRRGMDGGCHFEAFTRGGEHRGRGRGEALSDSNRLAE